MAHYRNVLVKLEMESFASKSLMEAPTKMEDAQGLIEVFGILLNETRSKIHSTREIERALTFIIDF